ncbi:cell division protein FtsQ/DivIB [Sutterella sp.]|uniref:cell division protein FtsQ/DivIB n=1 Tax=Sutterella sp. TaxID=1981025 RepID=UPI0026DF6910|nr:cell division protein FtsQ/DivIB [Sutterella sp.]MDO5530832.1 cell division protein FtsQ/DivIB [Sutterella sp.]
MADEALIAIKQGGGALRQIPLGEDPEEAAARRRAGGLRRFLAFLLVVLLGCGIWYGVEHIPELERVDYVRLKRLEMEGDTAKVPLVRLKEAVEPVLEGRSFFTVNLEEVRTAAETVPWVKRAAVRRIWPDRVIVRVEVYEAVAQYEDGRLVSIEGKLFAANPDEGAEAGALPSFSGAAEEVPEILRRWRRFSSLFSGLPFRITEIALSDRGGWSLTVQGPEVPPTRIELGRDRSGTALEERLRQVAAAWPRMVEVFGGPPSAIDARYRRAISARKTDRAALEAYLAENTRPAQAPESAETTGQQNEDGDDADDAADSVNQTTGGGNTAAETNSQRAE